MSHFLFYLFSAIALLASLMVVLNRNTVNGAMFMIMAFLGTAALFITLEAYFLAILQVLVYAGAVMVLFLFIVMLLNVDTQERVRPNMPSLAGSLVGLFLLSAGVLYFLFGAPELQGLEKVPAILTPGDSADEAMAFATTAKAFGYGLFTKYMLPFQVAGFLLLIAMIGVISISRNTDKQTPEDV